MEQWAIFTVLWINVAVPVQTATAMMIEGLQGYMAWRFQAVVMCWLVIWWIMAAYTNDNETYFKFWRQLYLAVGLYVICATAGPFNYWVVGFVNGLIEGFSTAVVSALNKGQEYNAGAFDILAVRAYAIGLAIYKNIPSYSFKGALLGVVVFAYWFFALAAIVWMFAIKLIAFVMTSFMIPWGAVFIPLYFFPLTRGFFLGWLGVLMTGVLTQVFSAGLGAMFIFVLMTIMDMMGSGLKGTLAAEVDGNPVVGQLMMLIVTALVCIIFGMMATGIVLVAARISNGAMAAVGQPSMPRGTPSEPRDQADSPSGSASPSGSPVASGGAPGGGSGGGGVGVNGGGGSVPFVPPRQYAFSHTVGAAP